MTAIRFDSERFDYQSELPDTCNAGNRFYGKDLGEALAAAFGARGFRAACIDEDWGWLVGGSIGDDCRFEAAIYNLADHGEGGRPGIGSWGIVLKAQRRRKLLGFIPGWAQADVPAELADALDSSIRAWGAAPAPWIDGPER